MFLGGVYHDGKQEEADHEVSFFGSTWGYVTILGLLIVESVFLSWIYDRFGCDEETCEIIQKFEARIDDLEA